MRKPGLFIVVFVVVVALSGSAWADHVINFKNGTSLPVKAYRVEDGTIHVDLGGNAFMAFPMAMVEQIENPTRSLNLKPSTIHPDDAGPMIAISGQGPSNSRGAAKSGATHQPKSKNPGGNGALPAASQNDQNGRDVRFSVADSGATNLSNTGGNGRLRGAQRRGNKYVMSGQRADKEVPKEVQIRGGGPRPLPPGFKPPNPGTDTPKKEGGSGK